MSTETKNLLERIDAQLEDGNMGPKTRRTLQEARAEIERLRLRAEKAEAALSATTPAEAQP